jgi:predicted transcriptional regulator
MAKIDVTIPDDLKEILQELADDGGQSLSSVTADCIKLGILDFIESRNKMEVYRKLRDQRRQRDNGGQ